MPYDSLLEASKGLGDLASYAPDNEALGSPGAQTQQCSRISHRPKRVKISDANGNSNATKHVLFDLLQQIGHKTHAYPESLN